MNVLDTWLIRVAKAFQTLKPYRCVTLQHLVSVSPPAFGHSLVAQAAQVKVAFRSITRIGPAVVPRCRKWRRKRRYNADILLSRAEKPCQYLQCQHALWYLQYQNRLFSFLDKYDRAFIVAADNVGSKQFQDIRRVHLICASFVLPQSQ